jgi:hypothetical protein
LPWDGDSGHLEGDIAAVADDLCADLDQRRCQRAQEIADILSERMKLEPHRVGGERTARQPGWTKFQVRRNNKKLPSKNFAAAGAPNSGSPNNSAAPVANATPTPKQSTPKIIFNARQTATGSSAARL